MKTRRITVEALEVFCRCPALYQFSHGNIIKKLQPKITIPQKIIQYAYLYALNSNHCITWRELLNITNRFAIENETINNRSDWKIYREKAIAYLNTLSTWYYEFYIKETLPGYTDIDIPLNYRDFILTTRVPVLKQSEPLTLIFFNSKSTDQQSIANYHLYNNISYRIAAAGVANYTDSNEVKIQEFAISEDRTDSLQQAEGRIIFNEVLLDKSHHNKLYKRLDQILVGIEKNFDYPVFSKRCKKCPFNKRCRL